MAEDPPSPTLQEHIEQALADPDSPQAAALNALSEEIGRTLARIVFSNLQKYPDIVDEDDPRLLELQPSIAEPQWVYFMADEETGLIKIGISTNVKQRQAAVARNIGRKVALIGSLPGTFATETRLHRILAPHRFNGEWFRPGHWFAVVVDSLNLGFDAAALIARLTVLEGRDG